MGNGEKTGYHRAAKAVRESSGSTRVWGMATALIGVLAAAAALGFVDLRDDVIVSTAWATDTAPKWHDHVDIRLDHLERPELAIQLAQATSAMSRVEAAADLAQENAADIKVIKSELGHLKDGQTRAQSDRDRILTILDRLSVRSQ